MSFLPPCLRLNTVCQAARFFQVRRTTNQSAKAVRPVGIGQKRTQYRPAEELSSCPDLRRDRDLVYLAVLAFLMLLAAAVLTVDTLFLVTFGLFILVAIATFISMEMRRSEEEGVVVDGSTKTYLKQLNTAIDQAYKGAFNFRVGGELKFTTIMVRLGAAYYGNPYKDINGEKGSRLNLSSGLGYRDKGFFVDLTYVHAMNKDVQFAYRPANSPYSGASIKNTTGNVYLTLGFKI